jgi:hypothetical protein
MALLLLIVPCQPLSIRGAVATGAFFSGITTTSGGHVQLNVEGEESARWVDHADPSASAAPWP